MTWRAVVFRAAPSDKPRVVSLMASTAASREEEARGNYNFSIIPDASLPMSLCTTFNEWNCSIDYGTTNAKTAVILKAFATLSGVDRSP